MFNARGEFANSKNVLYVYLYESFFEQYIGIKYTIQIPITSKKKNNERSIYRLVNKTSMNVYHATMSTWFLSLFSY